MRKISKRGALELSMSTVVILVIAITLLIMGFVLVRKIMCGAIGLTEEISNKVKSEIDRLFGAVGGEIQCIGSMEAVKMVPGPPTDLVICGIKLPAGFERATYSAELVSVSSNEISEDKINSWIVKKTWSEEIAAGETKYKKILRLNIDNNAPEGSIVLNLKFYRNGNFIGSEALDFEVSRQGIIRTAIC